MTLPADSSGWSQEAEGQPRSQRDDHPRQNSAYRPGRPGREFIGEPVIPFGLPDGRPNRSPGAPASFRWRDLTCEVEGVVSEWWDFGRPSRRQRAYGEGYQRRAPERGSYGFGRRHFIVRCGPVVYHLCYDRRPAPGHPEGTWTLLERRSPAPP